MRLLLLILKALCFVNAKNRFIFNAQLLHLKEKSLNESVSQMTAYRIMVHWGANNNNSIAAAESLFAKIKRTIQLVKSAT